MGPNDMQEMFLLVGFEMLIEPTASGNDVFIPEEDAARMLTGDDWVDYLCRRLL